MCDVCFELESAYALAVRRLARFSEGRDVATNPQLRQQEEQWEKAVTEAHAALVQHRDQTHEGADQSRL
jgi:hypothetical protein